MALTSIWLIYYLRGRLLHLIPLPMLGGIDNKGDQKQGFPIAYFCA